VSDLTAGLNPAQVQAVLHPPGPLAIVAGPGSGKTAVLTRRAAALISAGVDPRAILAVTFTNKAAAQLRERLATLLAGQGAAGAWVCTFHAFALRVLRANPAAAGLPPRFSIVDATESIGVLRAVLAAAGVLAELSTTEATATTKAAAVWVSKRKNGVPVPVRPPWAPPGVDAATVAAAYQTRLAALGAVDFDDLLCLTRDVLANYPDIAAAYGTRFEHILVDEYQDTNPVQDRILRLLTATQKVLSLTVVGDLDQAIYAFRGADDTIMATFTATYPDAVVIKLGQNYRSSSNIVDAARAIISANASPHRPDLHTAAGPGVPVRIVACDSDREEGEWVAADIRAGGSGSVAILVRTHALTRAIEQGLVAAALTYEVIGGARFFDRAEVRDALAYLRFAVNTADLLALARVVNTPRRGLGSVFWASALAALEAHARVGDALAGAATSAKAAAGVAQLSAALLAIRDAMAAGPVAAVQATLEATGLLAHVRAADQRAGTDKATNLTELVAAAAAFERDGAATDARGVALGSLSGPARCEAFLEMAALLSQGEADGGVAALARVNIMTMHAAKGREFDRVYVCGAESGLLPHARATSAADVAEERRLFYVACTRARDTLVITYTGARWMYDGVRATGPSPFLNSLPPQVVRLLAQGRPPGRRAGGSGSPPRAYTPYSPARTVAALVVGLTPDQVPVGTMVEHAMFGPGRVSECGAAVIRVQFADRSVLLSLAAAPLSLIPPL